MHNKKVVLQDKFWLHYKDLVRTEMIPYQWNVLNDNINIKIERERDDKSIPNEKSHAIENFKIAAGINTGRHYGWVFQDSDVYKWLEAVAHTLNSHMDENLKSLADSVVDLIESAQEADGYLNTFFTIEAPDRKFKRLAESHELYCAGHFLEAAAAYYEATKCKKALKIACKLADYVDSVFGEAEGKIHGYDGHEEIEIGLMKLYHITKESRYLELSKYFLLIRGVDKEFFEKQMLEDWKNPPLINGMERCSPSYFQTHQPVLEQETAEGHAVRLVYLCTALADVAASTGDERLLSTCKKLWRNIVDKRMYITGGIGSTVSGEAFTLDYDLPNDTMYCETCASIGLIFFAYQMLRNEAKGEYADVIERALYNTILSGMSLDGRHFFYVNPLEVVPDNSKKDPGKSHVKCVRPEWLGCACCPPNLARLLASIEKYVYIQNKGCVLTNLFMSCQGSFEMQDGIFNVQQRTEYPDNDFIEFELDCQGNQIVDFGIRIPAWANSYKLFLNDKEIETEVNNGFAYITKNFKKDILKIIFEMKVERWYANPCVRSDIGKVAITRGPIVYCLEEVDNGNNLNTLSLDKNEKLNYKFNNNLFGGVGTITAKGNRIEITNEDENILYHKDQSFIKKVKQELKWIPYYCWANRGENEMTVWVREETV